MKGLKEPSWKTGQMPGIGRDVRVTDKETGDGVLDLTEANDLKAEDTRADVKTRLPVEDPSGGSD